MATVFVTRLDGGQMKNEGLCLKCAKELGIKPVTDMLDKLGIQGEELDETLDSCEDALEEFASADEDGGDFSDSSDDTDNADDDNKIDGNVANVGSGSDAQSSDAAAKPSENNDDSKNKSAAGGNGRTSGDIPMPFPFGNIIPNLFANVMRTGGGDTAKGNNDDKPSEKNQKYKFLTAFCDNLTDKAAQGKLDRIIGRDRELERVIQILCRRQKNNPCLVGEPGVGKTAIAEALAQRIADGNVPYALKDKEIFQLDLPAMIAGTQYRGQFEKRFTGLISEIKKHKNAILVIDEIHNIIGAGGNSEGSMDAANMIKPALSRGEIQVIGATTLDEYRKYIEKDGALERRFQPVTVNEPSIDDSVKMIDNIKKYYEDFHGIKIPDETVRNAVVLSERYITDRFLPDKAIDLIDEAASHKAINSPCIAEKKKVDEEMASLGKEKTNTENLADGNDEKYKLLADIKVRELKLLERREKLEHECDALSLATSDLAEVIEIWTGIPATSITESEFEQLNTLEERLSKHVIGQQEAVRAVSQAIRRKRSGVSAKRKPVSFLFAGPTGVGKTELAKTLANELFKTPDNLIRIDMSEYADRWNTSRFTGSAPGYVGYDEGGQLTEKVRRHPYSIILFDEIDKAHPDVLDILLQVLDDGRMTDGKGKIVNFENTVIIMTTNAGAGKSISVAGFSHTEEEQNKEKTEKAISKFLKPEFINRIDDIITFRALTREDFSKIADIMLSELSDTLAQQNITLRYTDDVKKKVADESYSDKFGARNMRRYIQSNLEDVISDKIIENYKSGIIGISISVKNGEFSVCAM